MHSAKTLSIMFLITFLFAGSSLNFYPAEAQAQSAARPLTNNDVISLARAGLSDAAIVSTIQKSPTQFDLGPEALINLKKSGVSNTVIEAMIEGGGPSPAESAQVPPPVEEGSPPPPEVPEAPPPPPPIMVFEPELVILPGTYVYFCPGIVAADIFFYNGFWYRPYRGYWYRSLAYNGVWVSIAPPSIFLTLPPDYRVRVHEFPHIRYHDFYRNWRAWHRDKYWDHHEQWRKHQHWYREHQQRVGPPPRPTPPPRVTPPPKPAPPKPGEPAPPKLAPPKAAPPKPGEPAPPKLAPPKAAPPKPGEPAPPSKGEERK